VPDFHPLLQWLHTQMTALTSNLAAVAANHPAPARQVVIYTVVTTGLIWAVVKIAKKFSK
jgi:hypothetical protein